MIEVFHKIEVTFEKAKPEFESHQLETFASLCKNYDWYPEAIDDGTLYKNALKRNEKIIFDLKYHGATNVVIHGYMDMSGRVVDKFLVGEDK